MASLRLAYTKCLAIKQCHSGIAAIGRWQASSYTKTSQERHKTMRSPLPGLGIRIQYDQLSKKTWNVPKGVQYRLRQDVLNGLGFDETLFKIDHKSDRSNGSADQKKMLYEFLALDRAKKIQLLLHLGNKRLQLFLGELATFGVQLSSGELEVFGTHLSSDDYAVLSEVGIAYISTSNLIERLRLTDVLYACGALSTAYMKAFLNHVLLEWPSPLLDTSKLLQLLFYISIFRNASPMLMVQIEAYLENKLSQLTTSQIGLVCHAFFCTNCTIKSYTLIEAIAQHLSSTDVQFGSTQLYLVTNIMKVMHHAGYNKASFYESVGLKLCHSEMIKYDNRMSNLSNIIAAFASIGYSHDELFRSVSDRAEEMVRYEANRIQLRMKDLGRIIMSYHKLQLPVSEVLVEELKRQMENDLVTGHLKKMHPQAFIEALVALSMSDVYIADQLSDVFSSQTFKRKIDEDFQCIQLDTMVQLECPEYTGNRLPQEDVMKFVKARDAMRGLALHSRQGLAAIWLTLEELLGGQQYVKCHYITNFTRIPDLEIRLDRNKERNPERWNHSPDSSPEEWRLREQHMHKLDRVQEVEHEQGVMAELLKEHNCHIPKRNQASNQHFWPEPKKDQLEEILESHPYYWRHTARVTIKVLSYNQYVRNKPLLLGVHQVEVRALKKMGYHVMLLCPHDAMRIDEASPDDRRILVESLILEPIRRSISDYDYVQK